MVRYQKSISCGIDFGTTNSTVAVARDEEAIALEIDPKSKNPMILKSVIYINPSHQKEVGRTAIERYLWDIKHIEAKAPMLVETGRKVKTFGPSTASGAGPIIWIPEVVEVDISGRGRLLQSLKSVLTSETFTGTNVFGKFYAVENLLAIILSEMRRRAESMLGNKIESVVLGRPVRYVGHGKEELALERMTRVANMAGFKNVSFEYEPVGAALNYGINIKSNTKILVFDFGGGTLDVCVMSFPGKKIESISGRPIGGDLIDSILVANKLLRYFGGKATISGKMPMPRYFLQALSNWYTTTTFKNVKDLGTLEELRIRADDREAVGRLKRLIINDWGYRFFKKVDVAKVKLSMKSKTEFRFGDLEISETIKRQELEEMLTEELKETNKCIDEALALAGVRIEAIDKVLITGGSSKIPIFLRLLEDKFGVEKLVLGDRYTSVALGLALRASEVYGD